MVSSTQQGLPAPQTSPISLFISSEYAPDEDRANWMGEEKKVKLATGKRHRPDLRVPPHPQFPGLPAVSFHIVCQLYHASPLGLPAFLIFRHLKLHPSSKCSTLSSPPKHVRTHTHPHPHPSPFDLIFNSLQPPLSRFPFSTSPILAPVTPKPNPLTSTLPYYSFSSLPGPIKSLLSQSFNFSRLSLQVPLSPGHTTPCHTSPECDPTFHRSSPSSNASPNL